MASIQRYASKRYGRLWRVQYRDSGGVSRTKSGFRTKAAAGDWAARNTVHLRDGSWVPPELKRKTVEAYYAVWAAGLLDKRPSTLSAYSAAWRKHVAPVWGGYQVGSVTRSALQEWVSAFSASASPAVVRRAVFVLSAVLGEAVSEGSLAVNPAVGVKLPRRPASPGVALTANQVAALAAAVPGEVSSLVLVLAYTGIRWGEAAGLTVGDIDTAARVINVRRSASTIDSRVVVGPPKGGKARVVGYPLGLSSVVSSVVSGRGSKAVVWPDAVGGYRRPLSQTRGWRNAVAACAASDDTFPAGLRVHDLRHSAASMMIASGATVLEVQRQLGHSSPAITLNIYSHLLGDSPAPAVDSMKVVVDLS